MRHYGNQWNTYPSMTQAQYNTYLQSYMQQHNPAYAIPPQPGPYSTYEYLVYHGVIPQFQPPPPPMPSSYSMRTSRERPEKPSTRNPELDTPEEIAKWIEQRKKHFPTRARIEAKANTERMKEERGALRKSELSKLELKLRQKIKFMESEFGDKKKMKKRKNKGKRDVPQKKENIAQAQPVIEQKQHEEMEEGEIAVEQQAPQQLKKIAPQKKKEKFDRFKYRKNNLLNALVKTEANKEHSVLLQIFRYFVKNNIV